MPRISALKGTGFPSDTNPVDYLLRMVNEKKSPIEFQDNIQMLSKEAIAEFKRQSNSGQDESPVEGKYSIANLDSASLTSNTVTRESSGTKISAKGKPAKQLLDHFQKLNTQVQKRTPSTLQKFGLLFARTSKNVLRHVRLFVIFNVQNLFSIMLAVIIYWHMNRDYDVGDPADVSVNIHNRVGSFFFIIMNMYINFLINTCFKMEEESMVVLKEISAGTYSPTLYFWAKSMADFLFFSPALLLQAVLVEVADLVPRLVAHAYRLCHVRPCPGIGLVGVAHRELIWTCPWLSG